MYVSTVLLSQTPHPTPGSSLDPTIPGPPREDLESRSPNWGPEFRGLGVSGFRGLGVGLRI